ncbi:MAG: cation:proton antiporter [Thermoleophilia bacterium]|nr:cation:proton antiporter [Thermoleophilia bacterium]
MEIPEGLDSLFAIVLVSALAPLIVGLLPGPRIPEVVLLLVLGMVIGPHVLDVAESGSAIALIANVGLGFLFFLAGFELDLAVLRGPDGRGAVAAWTIAMVGALAVVGALAAAGFVRAFLPVAIALTTTALGTLLPMLRDSGETTGPFGRAILANGAIGEFLPIIAISLFLGARGAWHSLALLIGFGAVAFLVSRASRHLKGRSIAALVRMGSETSSQTAVRVAVVLLVALLLLAGELGLDVVLGAFAAGIVLRMTLPEGDKPLEHKLEGLAFGFFVPAFFVVSGMRVDLPSILDDPARMFVFFVLMVALRGLPVLLVFRSRLPGRDALRLGLLSATALPLIVAITEIGLATGEMRDENGAALVGAGLLTVLVCPVVAKILARPGAHALPAAPA